MHFGGMVNRESMILLLLEHKADVNMQENVVSEGLGLMHAVDSG